MPSVSDTSCCLSHPFHNLIPDCTSVVFSYFIQTADKPLTEYSRQELHFFSRFIRCWHFLHLFNVDINVTQFLRRTRGEKFTLYFVDASHNKSMDNETFVYFRGIHELRINYTSQCPVYNDEAFANLRGIQKLSMEGVTHISSQAFVNLRGISKLNMAWCKQIEDSAFVNIRGVQHLNIDHCSQITGKAFRNLRGVRCLMMKRCTNSQLRDQDFENLIGIRALQLSGCRQLRGEALKFLRGVTFLDMTELSQISPEMFSNIRGVRQLICSNMCDEALIHLRGVQSITLGRESSTTGNSLENLRGAQKVIIPGGGKQSGHMTDEDMRNLMGALEVNLSSRHGLSDDSLKFFEHAEKLNISYNKRFTGEGFKHLFKLKDLNATGCTGLLDRHFAHLRHVEFLSLGYCAQITDEAITHLSNLKELCVGGCSQLTHRILNQLCDSLEVLEIHNTNIRLAEEDRDRVMRLIPNLRRFLFDEESCDIHLLRDIKREMEKKRS